MDIRKIQNYWQVEAEEALKVAMHLFEKEDYSYSLFFGHLAVEKILKAVYVQKKKEHSPFIHNLEKLAELAGVPLTMKQKEQILNITSFNIAARYPD